jgi:outer membrane protein assembly factor BamE (lipoprotein component of BamABCDE complex)
MKRIARLLGPYAAIVAVLFAIVFFLFSHATAWSAFTIVKNGMTQTEVRNAMGNPYFVRRDTPDSTTYFYGGFRCLKWCSMEVNFDASGIVTGKFHDH